MHTHVYTHVTCRDGERERERAKEGGRWGGGGTSNNVETLISAFAIHVALRGGSLPTAKRAFASLKSLNQRNETTSPYTLCNPSKEPSPERPHL